MYVGIGGVVFKTSSIGNRVRKVHGCKCMFRVKELITLKKNY